MYNYKKTDYRVAIVIACCIIPWVIVWVILMAAK